MRGRADPWLLLIVPGAALAAFGGARLAAPPPAGDIEAKASAMDLRVARLERGLDRALVEMARHRAEVQGRLDAMEASRGGPDPARTAPDGNGSAPEADARPVEEGDPARAEVVLGLAAEPASAAHAAAIRRLAGMAVHGWGPPLAEREFAWSVALIDREARRGRITPEEAADLAREFGALDIGHGARPVLAKAVALGWGHDERLRGFLARLGTNAEPALHLGVLAGLDDEHPGAAFSEYVLRIIRDERDPEVLAVAFGLDRIEAAATAATAPGLVRALETRVLDGSLDAEGRANAGLAIAVASLRAPEVGVVTLRRLAEIETDSAVAERYRAAAAALEAGGATLKSLERLFEE